MPAFGEKALASGAVDRTIDPAAAEKRRIRSIYDCVDRQCCDVVNDDLDAGCDGCWFHVWN